ncbi:cation:proton antiporter [Halalkalibacterium halodurans]|uniref:Na+/H+ antiporter n=1 Tax=Halalkalibacterium halodurans (strain ATCC BAA-125 / DSM 18197 / FERM 7344 / JCM 9153 / C-125) TaxID=272558 RepID=Q9K908_HALH5|nr:cation:proton antiporter [Halalkalibacterium halodurans]MDY7223395.1 cation:proton antiporter [Halalkalibacterium halodurans]MDY7242616.1 cation:proton antiporter [Halalkalibacterium halodurans]MED3647306.1 cation:proton antiporter [Halalkalibacterium halodurans]BAB06563.1 Na+/H+ antiporter [Halalkalibacterium halodurans C-125]
MIDHPITDPVLIFAIAMVVFFVAPLLMSRLRIPGIIGLILAGVVIGPNGFALLDRDPTIVLLGTVGLLYIIFIAGLEIDLEGFKKYRNRSVLFGTLSFTIPFLFGLVFTFILGFSTPAAILLASILGSHTLLAYPIASRLGISKDRGVTTAVGGTIMTDTLALLVLAIVAGSMQGELNSTFWFTIAVSLVLYVAITLILIPILAKSFFRTMSSEGALEFIFVMSILFVTAYGATLAGLEPIIGAFLAGLALNRFILEHSPLMNRIKFVGNALFIPFFLLSVGMLMDIRVLLGDPSAWLLAALVVIFVQLGKFLAAFISGKLYNYSMDQIKLMFGLSVPQAAATLAATLVGFDLGLFDSAVVNAVIVMILVTCMVGPYVVEKYARKLALEEELKPFDPSEAPERVMVPIANPKTVESLLDLAFIVRGQSSEPLYPLTVAQGTNGDAESEVAKAEKVLAHAVTYAAGASVPIQMLTRLDPNIASGIIRAIEETRITTLVIGWNGKRSTPQLIFGGILDQLLERTEEMVLVSKLGHPLNTTKRIVLVLPSGVDHKTGYYRSLRTVKRLANQVGATLVCVVVKDDARPYEKTIKEIKPDVSTTVVGISSWNEWHKQWMLTLRADDLVVVLSARRGTLAWHPQLEQLPNVLAKANPESFIMIYPPETEKTDSRGSRGTDVPRMMSSRSYED